MGLALHSPDDHQGLAEVALDLPRGVGQGHEHLLGPAALPDLILDDGVLAAEPILVPPPLKDPLGRVALLPGNAQVRLQYPVDDAGAGRILSLSKGWGGGADSAAGSPAAPSRPASCAPCPGASRTPGRLPEGSSLPPCRPGELARTAPRGTSITPSKDW